MKKIVTLILVAVLLFSMCSCNINFMLPEESENGNQSKQPIKISKVVMTDVYKTFPERSSSNPVTSFTDGKYNYFYFKIGEIGRVPIAYSNVKFYQGIGTRTLEFETNESVEQTIASATEQCFSVAVSSKISTSIGTSSGVSNQTTGASVSYSALLENSIETTSSSSTSKTLTKSISDTFSKCERDTFELTPDCPAGYYRYTVYADCEIFMSIKADKDTSTFEYTILSYVKGNTKIEGWYYSQNGYFESEETYSESLKKLELTEEMLESIDLYGDLDKFVKIGEVTYSFDCNETIETDKQFSVWRELSDGFDIDLLNELGRDTAHIKLNCKLVSPSGDCQAKFRLLAGEEEIWIDDWVQVTPSGTQISEEITIGIDDLKNYGTELTFQFICRSDGWWDVLKNGYKIENGTITVNFEED